MYGEKIFIRTPEGNEALSNKDLQNLSYKVHMVLNLCDGKSRYNFLESNLRRVDNLSDIIKHLLENNLITELNEESKRQFSFTKKLGVSAPAAESEKLDDIEAQLDQSFNQRKITSNTSPNQHDFIKAISMMSEALSEFFSDEVLEWSMEAETCSTLEEMELLMTNFEKIYAKNSGRGKANDVLNKVRQAV